MKTQLLVQDYYGGKFFIEQNKDKELTIFVVDDNKVYRSLMKHALKRSNFTILSFATGEECLDYLDLKPDLIILDYHLDGVNPYAMKGDEISEIIRERLPGTEVVIMSSDSKFQFISDVKLSKRLIYKDDKIFPKITKYVENVVKHADKRKSEHNRTLAYIITLIVMFIIPIVLLFLLLK